MPVLAHCIAAYPGIEWGTFDSVIELLREWSVLDARTWKYKPVHVRAQPVSHARNVQVKYALEKLPAADAWPFTAEPADVLVWQDGDVQTTGGDVLELAQRLLEMPDEVGLLGVPVPKQAYGGKLHWNVIPGEFAAATSFFAPFRIERIGFGLVAVRASVFAALTKPYFTFEYDAGGTLLGEDYGFCDAVRLAGFECWADPRFERVTHNFIRQTSLADVVEQAHEIRAQEARDG